MPKGEAVVGRVHEVVGPVGKGVRAIGGETHDLAFIAIAAVPHHLAAHRVQEAQRIGEVRAVRDLDPAAFAPGAHRADEIARAVNRGCRARVPRGTEERTRDMGQMVLDLGRLEREAPRLDPEFAGQRLLQRTEGAAAHEHPAERDELARAREGGGDLLAGIGERVAADGDELDVRHRDAAHPQAFRDGQLGEAGVILAPVQPFFGDRGHRPAINDEGGRRAGVERIDAENGGHGGKLGAPPR